LQEILVLQGLFGFFVWSAMAALERWFFLHTGEVQGSIPCAPTRIAINRSGGYHRSISMKTTDDAARFEVGIYFVDTTYGQEGDQWEAESAALKAELEAEFGLPLQNDDIGPGWSFPVFAAQVTDYDWLLRLACVGRRPAA
jgi:hypothetical protein